MPTKTEPPAAVAANGNTWNEIMAAFESHLYQQGRSDATIASYSSCMKIFADFYRTSLEKPGPYIDRIQEADIVAFTNYLRFERHLSAATLNRYIAALRSFSQFVFVKGWHRRLLTKMIKSHHVLANKEELPLSKADVRRLLSAVDLKRRNGHRNLAILQLFIQCGLRVSELIHLSRDDVVLNKTNGSLRVRNESGENKRIIPLNSVVRRALRSYLDDRGPMADHEPLFLSERQSRLSIQAVQYLVKRYLCLLDREDLSAKDLRHHFAVAFYARSKHLTVTQQILGHRNILSTVRYAKIAETNRKGPDD